MDTIARYAENLQILRKCEENAKKVGIEMDKWFMLEMEFMFSSNDGLVMKYMETPRGIAICSYLGEGDELVERILSGKEKVQLQEKERRVEMDSIRPDYYKCGKYECIDYINDKNFNFNLGNVCKYITRAGLKDDVDAVEDLKKARQYLDFELKRLTEE